jgi:hypothetical protein
MKPIAELLTQARSTPAPAAFAAKFPQQDVVVAEPYEKGKSYVGASKTPLHPSSVWMALPRAPGQAVPVGRDARAVVQLDHAAVSRLHLVMAWAGDGWKAMDRSSNGTWLDEEKMPPQQAVPMKYGAMVRLGRAMVVRVLTPEAVVELSRAPAAAPAAPPPPRPVDKKAQTDRFPAIADNLMPSPESSDELDPGLGPSSPGAVTVRIGGPPSNVPTQRQQRPGPPQPPPPKPAGGDDIEFEFDLDFSDGKGGFA